MKKAITLALVLVLALSLAACGGKDTGTGSTGGNSTAPSASTKPTTSDNGATTTPPASDDGDNGNAAAPGGFLNLYGDPLTVPETQGSIEDAVGVSIEFQRIVRRYTDEFVGWVFKPDGCTVMYTIYEFDTETGEVTDASMWYGGFTDTALFSASFQESLSSSFEAWLRGYNVGEEYYGFYTWPAIQANHGTEYATWDDAVEQGCYKSDENYILIE
jgi:hypothetical protein